MSEEKAPQSKNVPVSKIKPLAIAAEKLISTEEGLRTQKAEAAKALHDLIGSADLTVNGRRFRAVCRKRTDKATGVEREEYLLKTESSVSEFNF